MEADPGLFGPDSVTWRVHADPAMAIGGLRALLLQALHPLAMAGVAQFSNYQADPWSRLYRTAEYVATVTFDTTTNAERAAARVRGLHRKGKGVEPESGQAYRIDDPELLRWVHVCEVESFLNVTTRAGLRLSASEKDRYYAEQVRAATLIGATDVPDSVAAVEDYYAGIRPQLRLTAAAREGARFILFPPMPTKVGLSPARPAWAALGLAAAGTMPRWARRLYHLPGVPTTDLGATVTAIALRQAVLLVPSSVRTGPHLKAARDRLSLAG